MKQLMISLDKKILDPSSAVAERMIEYGKKNELFLLIPASQEKSVELSESVHVWSTGGNTLQQYFRLKKLGRQLIRDFRLTEITVQDPGFIGAVGRWLKKKTGAKLEIQVHGDFYGSNYYKKSFKDYLAYFVLGKKNISSADQVRIVGERQKASLLALGIPEEKIVKRPIMVKTAPGKQLVFSNFDKVFLSLGRLEPVKNLSWLIEVFAKVIKEHQKNFLLLIVGDGSDKKKLQKLITHHGVEKNIVLKDWTASPQDYYASVDCVVMPSLSESYGLVAMEAAEAGCKIIMNDVGVANYELKPSNKVSILPINDEERWIQAILKV